MPRLPSAPVTANIIAALALIASLVAVCVSTHFMWRDYSFSRSYRIACAVEEIPPIKRGGGRPAYKLTFRPMADGVSAGATIAYFPVESDADLVEMVIREPDSTFDLSELLKGYERQLFREIEERTLKPANYQADNVRVYNRRQIKISAGIIPGMN